MTIPDFDLELLARQFTSIGGPVMAILVLISIIALGTTISKVFEFARLGVGSHRRVERALRLWTAGDRKSAFESVELHKAALSRVAAETMRSIGWMPDQVESARENGLAVASELLAKMGRRVRLLETIVQAAPMLGLLGTVLGMIDSFGEMARSGGVGDPAQLAAGIWVALSTTAAGLAVAIPFYFVSSWLEDRIERERVAMEAAISRILSRTRSHASRTTEVGTRQPATATVPGQPERERSFSLSEPVQRTEIGGGR